MDFVIPVLQRAALIENPGPNGYVRISDNLPAQNPGPKQILIRLTHSGICGSDVRALLGWSSYQRIVGHEGVGTVVKVGSESLKPMLGKRVGVKWLYRACGKCYCCQRGFPNSCPDQNNTGRDVLGTLQEYIVADGSYVTVIPDGLQSDLVSPLLCGGLTMMGAMSKLDGKLTTGDWVVILGSGGGLGHLGVQIAARVKGYKVIAVDYGQLKRDLSFTSGADFYVDLATDQVEQRVKALTSRGADAVLVVSGSKDAFRVASQLVRHMGTIVCIGLPPNDFNLPIPASLCSARALTISGVTTGTEQQMEELLQYALEGVIRPVIEVLDFKQTPDAFQRLRSDTVTGRIIVKIAD